MDAKYIALIVVVGVWLLSLLIFGILAFSFNAKHKVMSSDREKYFQEFDELKALNQDLIPLATDLKLRDGEELFVYEKMVRLYNDGIGKSKKQSRLYRKYNQNPDPDEDEDDRLWQTETGILRWTYSLKSTRHKFEQPDMKGPLIVTNERVLIVDGGKNLLIPIEDLIRVYPSMIPLGKEFYRGFMMTTKFGVYEVVNQNIETVVVLQELIERGKENE
ncbi:hypothetical protein [Mesoplasma lactucae]|uniref:Uncharacterized protein n=1 Tax=Mesoplasma lactucae ATCC 49193 TaxID=81460 RepID=A0A291IRF4_9MOLU|nr:hypothetical protein [Mesoplasma lactucae]ATG97369.1 hypothetical protein CP520_01175 [Mesoplasma lactucae ATCC 49193]ATZ20179.1 hypothetical protein MLACT_v1c03580 [Mesoplasma lactucae ATCC 49193]MCL8216928.1 hypothetical protein [Mesoplasma lactucae ATCC 49193]